MAPLIPPRSANASSASTASSDAVPLSRARWLIASILAALSVGGMALSLHDRPPASSVRTDQHSSATPALEEPELDSIVRLIDLNTAGPQALEMLPGIGPVLARRIVEDRTLHGEFASLDDIDRVRGIGPRTIDKFRSIAQVIPSPGAP